MSIIREVTIGNCRLIHADNRDVLPGLTADAIVTDPPYGIDAGRMSLGKWAGSRLEESGWDEQCPDLSILPPLPSIVWGGNYFSLPPSRAFLIWDKGAGFRGRDFAECEQAWCSFDGNARVFTYDPLARGDYRNRYHKTQKPIALMEWCLGFVPHARVILDPFMGSGSTGCACVNLGRHFIGIEQSEAIFDTAVKRITDAHRQADLFVDKPAYIAPVQEPLL